VDKDRLTKKYSSTTAIDNFPISRLNDFLPDSLDLYNSISVTRNSNTLDTEITFEQLETYFEYCYSGVFSIAGEISGNAFVQAAPEMYNHFEGELDEFQDILAEIGNVLIGNFLTNLEKNSGPLGIVKAPMVFAPHSKSTIKMATRKNRILSLIGKVFDQHKCEKIEYTVTFKNKKFLIHLILLTSQMSYQDDRFPI